MMTAMKTMKTLTLIWRRGSTRTQKLQRMSYRLTRRTKQIKRKSHSGGSHRRKKGAKKEVEAVVTQNRSPKTKRKTTKVWTTRPQRRPVILHKAAILRDNKRAAATKENPAVRKKIAKIN